MGGVLEERVAAGFSRHPESAVGSKTWRLKGWDVTSHSAVRYIGRRAAAISRLIDVMFYRVKRASLLPEREFTASFNESRCLAKPEIQGGWLLNDHILSKIS